MVPIVGSSALPSAARGQPKLALLTTPLSAPNRGTGRRQLASRSTPLV